MLLQLCCDYCQVHLEKCASCNAWRARRPQRVCRHDVNIQQGGEQTSTKMRHFLLCGARQVHDLHTSLVLDHPDGNADQLHKCIVSDASGHGIFDGNVQVTRFSPPALQVHYHSNANCHTTASIAPDLYPQHYYLAAPNKCSQVILCLGFSHVFCR